MKEAEYIQFSWFSNEFVNQDIEQIYQGLVGVEAENSWKSKNVTPSNPFLYQSSVNNSELNHWVRISHERLDFVVRVAQLGEYRSIDPIPDVTSKLDDMIEKISALSSDKIVLHRVTK